MRASIAGALLMAVAGCGMTAPTDLKTRGRDGGNPATLDDLASGAANDFAIVSSSNDGASSSDLARPACPAGALFAGRIDYATGGGPSSVALADLDGDGMLDLAVANDRYLSIACPPPTVSVLLNRGGGAFAAKIDYVTGGDAAASVAAGDLDGDGRPDLVTCGYPGQMSVMLNDAAVPGTFPTHTDYWTHVAASVALGDLDGDGKLDVVVANSFGGASLLSVFFNQGGGALSAKVDYDIGADPSAVAIADVNGDGRPDLVAPNASNAVSVLLNQGNRAFAPHVDYATGVVASSVAVGDLDGDGRPDIAVTNECGAAPCTVGPTTASTVSVLINRGGGAFAPRVDFPTGPVPVSVAIADLDGDGKPDLAIAGAESDSVSVLLNNGKNGVLGFAPKVDYGTGSFPSYVAVGDVDGDGKPDLVMTNSYSNTVSVLLHCK